MEKEEVKYKKALKANVVTIIINMLLGIAKGIVGLLASSMLMLSDAIHSFSDVLSTVIVMIGLKIASKKPDKEHNYGHDKAEASMSKILALILFATGIFLGYEAVLAIVENDFQPQTQGALMLIVTAVSILTKEFMYRYKMYYAKKLNKPSLKADAWHHRSDALSSVAALIGIIGYLCGVYVFEPIATIAVALLIVKVAVDIYVEGERAMSDRAADAKTQEKIRAIILSCSKVKNIDVLRTRLSCSKLFVDVEIALEKDMPLVEAHDIAEKIHCDLEGCDLEIQHATVHINPFFESAEE